MKLKRLLVSALAVTLTFNSINVPMNVNAAEGPEPGNEAPDGELPGNEDPDPSGNENPEPNGELPNEDPTGDPNGEIPPEDPVPTPEPEDPIPTPDPNGEKPVRIQLYDMEVVLGNGSVTVTINEEFPNSAEELTAKAADVAANNEEVKSALNLNDGRTYSISNISPNGYAINDFDYVNVTQNVKVRVELKANEENDPIVPPVIKGYMIHYVDDVNDIPVKVDTVFPANADEVLAAVNSNVTNDVKSAFGQDLELGEVYISDNGVDTLAANFDYSTATENAFVKVFVKAKGAKVTFKFTALIYDSKEWNNQSYLKVRDQLPAYSFNAELDEFFADRNGVKPFAQEFIKTQEFFDATGYDETIKLGVGQCWIVNNGVESAMAQYDYSQSPAEDLEVIALVSGSGLTVPNGNLPIKYDKPAAYMTASFYNFNEDDWGAENWQFLFGGNRSGWPNQFTGGSSVVTGLAVNNLDNGFQLNVQMTNGSRNPFTNPVGTYGFPFVDGGNGYLVFDSDSHFTTTRNVENGNLKLYHDPGYINDNGYTKAFMPFNEITDYAGNQFRINEEKDYFFGMQIDLPFTMPVGGKLADGSDMMFEFHGDDDVWVFIDGKLVLDIGGVHGATTGTIDYATGARIVNGQSQGNLKDLFPNGLAEKEQHEMKLFYLERGAGKSNCYIKFNSTAFVEPVKYHYTENHHYLNKRTGDNPTFTKEDKDYESGTFEAKPIPTYNGVNYKLTKVTCDDVEVDIKDSYTTTNKNAKYDFYYELDEYSFQVIHEYVNKEDSSKSHTVKGDVEYYKNSETKTSQPKAEDPYVLTSCTINDKAAAATNHTFTADKDGNVVVKYTYVYELPKYNWDAKYYYEDPDHLGTYIEDTKLADSGKYSTSQTVSSKDKDGYVLNNTEVKTSNDTNFVDKGKVTSVTLTAAKDKDSSVRFYYNLKDYKYTVIYEYPDKDPEEHPGTYKTTVTTTGDPDADEYYELEKVTEKKDGKDPEDRPTKSTQDFNSDDDGDFTVTYKYKAREFNIKEFYVYLDGTNEIDKEDIRNEKYTIKTSSTAPATREYKENDYTFSYATTVTADKPSGVKQFGRSFNFTANPNKNIVVTYYYTKDAYSYKVVYEYEEEDGTTSTKTGDEGSYNKTIKTHGDPDVNDDLYELEKVVEKKTTGDPIDRPTEDHQEFNSKDDGDFVVTYKYKARLYNFKETYIYNHEDDALDSNKVTYNGTYKFERKSKPNASYAEHAADWVLDEVIIKDATGNPVDGVSHKGALIEDEYSFFSGINKNVEITYIYKAVYPEYDIVVRHFFETGSNENYVEDTSKMIKDSYKTTYDTKIDNVKDGVTYDFAYSKVSRNGGELVLGDDQNMTFTASKDGKVEVQYYYNAPEYKFTESHYYTHKSNPDLSKDFPNKVNTSYKFSKQSTAETTYNNVLFDLVKVVINGKEYKKGETGFAQSYMFEAQKDGNVDIKYYYEADYKTYTYTVINYYEDENGDYVPVTTVDHKEYKGNLTTEDTPKHNDEDYTLVDVKISTNDGDPKTAKDITSEQKFFSDEDGNVVVSYYHKAPVHKITINHHYDFLTGDALDDEVLGTATDYKVKTSADAVTDHNGIVWKLVKVRYDSEMGIFNFASNPARNIYPGTHYEFEGAYDKDVEIDFYYEADYNECNYSVKYFYETENGDIEDTSKANNQSYKGDKKVNLTDNDYIYDGKVYTFRESKFSEDGKNTYPNTTKEFNFNSDVDGNVAIEYYFNAPLFKLNVKHVYDHENDAKDGTVEEDPIDFKFTAEAKSKKEYNNDTFKLDKVTVNGEEITLSDLVKITDKDVKDGKVDVVFYYSAENPYFNYEIHHFYEVESGKFVESMPVDKGSYKNNKTAKAIFNYNGKTYVLKSSDYTSTLEPSKQDKNEDSYTFNAEVDKDFVVNFYYTAPKHTFEEDHFYNHISDSSLNGKIDNDPSDYTYDKESSPKYTYNGKTYKLVSVNINGNEVDKKNWKDVYTFSSFVDGDVKIVYTYEIDFDECSYLVEHYYETAPGEYTKANTKSDTYKGTEKISSNNVYNGITYDFEKSEFKSAKTGNEFKPGLNESYEIYSDDDKDAVIKFYYTAPVHNITEIHNYDHLNDDSKDSKENEVKFGPTEFKFDYTSNYKPEFKGVTFTLDSVTINGTTVTPEKSYKILASDYKGDVTIVYNYVASWATCNYEIHHFYEVSKGKYVEANSEDGTYQGTKDTAPNFSYNGETYTFEKSEYKSAKTSNVLTNSDKTEFSFFSDDDKDFVVNYYYNAPVYKITEVYNYDHLDDDTLDSKPGEVKFGPTEFSFDYTSKSKPVYKGVTFTLVSVTINKKTMPVEEAYKILASDYKDDVIITYNYVAEWPMYNVNVEHYYKVKENGKVDYVIDPSKSVSEKYKGTYTTDANTSYNGLTYTFEKADITSDTISGEKYDTSYTFESEKSHDVTVKFYYDAPKYSFTENHYYDHTDDDSLDGNILGKAIDYQFDIESKSKPEYKNVVFELTEVKVNGKKVEKFDSKIFDAYTDGDVVVDYYYTASWKPYNFTEKHFYEDANGNMVEDTAKTISKSYKEQDSKSIPELNGVPFDFSYVMLTKADETEPSKVYDESYSFFCEDDKDVTINYYYTAKKANITETFIYTHLDNPAELSGKDEVPTKSYTYDYTSYSRPNFNGIEWELVEVEVNKEKVSNEDSYTFNAVKDGDIEITYKYVASYPRYNFVEDHFYKDVDFNKQYDHKGTKEEYFSLKTSKAITTCPDDSNVYKLVAVKFVDAEGNATDAPELLNEYSFDPINKGDKDVHIQYFYELSTEDLNVKSFHHYTLNKGVLGTDKNTVKGIDNNFKRSYNYSEDIIPEYDGRTYKLTAIEVNGVKVTADLSTLKNYADTYEANTTVDYYYELTVPVLKGTVKHIYKNLWDGKTYTVDEDPDLFIDSLKRNVSLKKVYDGDTYEMINVIVDGVKDSEFTADSKSYEFSKDFAIEINYEFYGPDLTGTVVHEYYSNGKLVGSVETRNKTFKLKDEWTEDTLTKYAGKSDYKLAWVKVNDEKVSEIKKSYNFVIEKNSYKIVFRYTRNDPDPDPKDDPKDDSKDPEPTPSPKTPVVVTQTPPQAVAKLPQTGGLISSLWAPIVCGLALVFGGFSVLFIARKKEDEE